MQIADIVFGDHPLFLAPMEDVTDLSFRLLCKEFGVDMVYTEFISSDALIRHVYKTKSKLKIVKEERPITIQIFGNDTDTMIEAARICEEVRPDILDINFGCPVKNVASKGSGAGMLRTPDKMLEITSAIVKAVHIPVTVKTRLGWDDDHRIIVDLAERLQDCGISAMTIHGRTGVQMYTGKADWTLIGAVKNNPRMHIPIVGNGDITSPELCRQVFDRYGIDAVMIGRASIGAPWIFKNIRHYLTTGEKTQEESFDYYLSILKRQILHSVKQLDERRGILHIRRHIAASPLFSGIPEFKQMKIAMLRADTVVELFNIMNRISIV